MGKILHLEFESDNITKDDLRRFRVYEAILSYQYKREVLPAYSVLPMSENGWIG